MHLAPGGRKHEGVKNEILLLQRFISSFSWPTYEMFTSPLQIKLLPQANSIRFFEFNYARTPRKKFYMFLAKNKAYTVWGSRI